MVGVIFVALIASFKKGGIFLFLFFYLVRKACGAVDWGVWGRFDRSLICV